MQILSLQSFQLMAVRTNKHLIVTFYFCYEKKPSTADRLVGNLGSPKSSFDWLDGYFCLSNPHLEGNRRAHDICIMTYWHVRPREITNISTAVSYEHRFSSQKEIEITGIENDFIFWQIFSNGNELVLINLQVLTETKFDSIFPKGVR